MNLKTIIALSYLHFLDKYSDEIAACLVLSHYAKEELDLPKCKTEDFFNAVADTDADIDPQEFDRFYTWFYINYMIAPIDPKENT